MPSEVEIVNYALIMAQQSTIFTIDDQNKRGRTAKKIYPICRREVLSARNWGFAKKKVELNLDGDTPEYGWSYRFDKPGDYLKMVEVEDNYPYQEQETYILYNDNTLNIEYLYDLTNPNSYTPYFVTTLATRLAVDFSLVLKQDVVLSEKLFGVYTSRLATGGSLSAQSGGPVEFEIDDWTSARFGGGSGIGRNGQD